MSAHYENCCANARLPDFSSLGSTRPAIVLEMAGEHDQLLGGHGVFATTHWSIVLAARDGGPGSHGALETLCRIYWYPLYAFVRRRGHEAHDAQDMTQEFFARLLKQDFLHAVDPGKGRFRSFLLAAMEHFLAKEWRRVNAIKRGRGVTFIPLNEEATEGQYLQLPASSLSPEQIFDQQWATTVLDRVVGRLRDEFVADGKGPLFEQLKVFLTGEKRAGGYSELAVRLGTSEAALKMAVSRMRRRYGELLREEIAQTVACPEEVEVEFRALFAALSL